MGICMPASQIPHDEHMEGKLQMSNDCAQATAKLRCCTTGELI